MPPAEVNDDDEDVHAWAQAHGMNVIPDDNDNANQVAPIANVDVDEDEDVDAIQEDNDKEENKAVAHPMPATPNKTLLATMWQLATFYNSVATNYIQDADSDDNTVATSNQLGREGADVADLQEVYFWCKFKNT